MSANERGSGVLCSFCLRASFLLGVALTALAILPPNVGGKPSSSAQKPNSPRETGTKTTLTETEVVESFLSAVNCSPKDRSTKGGFDQAARFMAFDEMAKRSFGEAGWPKFSSAEQRELTSLFRRLIEIRFYPRWRRVFEKAHFSAASQAKQGEDTVVSGTLISDGKKSALSFRLTRTPAGLKLISMSVKNKDMLERTSARLQKGLANKGAAGLIAHLKKRTQEARKAGSEDQQLEELISGGK